MNSSLLKLGLHTKPRPLKIMVVGQKGVGKTALVVRFITKRFIGDYDTQSEKLYKFNTIIDNEIVSFEITDAPGLSGEKDTAILEKHIQGSDAFILMYSVTDKCSFDDCNRLKFLINYNKRRRNKLVSYKDSILDIPVILVGNKIDQSGDRMVKHEDGQKRYKEISCAGFHEISVKENPDAAWNVFRDVCRIWRVFTKFPKLKRSTSDVPTTSTSSSNSGGGGPFNISFSGRGSGGNGSNKTNSCDQPLIIRSSPDETHWASNNLLKTPFRERASTDGKILSRPRLGCHQILGGVGGGGGGSGCSSGGGSGNGGDCTPIMINSNGSGGGLLVHSMRTERRMSISMRGSNGSC